MLNNFNLTACCTTQQVLVIDGSNLLVFPNLHHVDLFVPSLLGLVLALEAKLVALLRLAQPSAGTTMVAWQA